MTNLAQPAQQQPLPPMPVSEVYAYYMRMVTAAQGPVKAKAIKHDIAERCGELYAAAFDAMKDSDDLGPWTPPIRLRFYYGKPLTNDVALQYVAQGLIPEPFSWEQQNAQQPDQWGLDWADFQSLRVRARHGDFGPELQMIEMGYQSARGPAEAMR